ncbi:hypothetical protein AGMMS49928_02010 [Spirochaetia bacterium]|nr:hypothetical protein AGMMS49928_02010 [Spirochaetia bacterium]
MIRKLFLLISLMGAGVLYADSLIPGADAAPSLFSPALAGSGGFITSQGSASASTMNPAATGDAQRIVFDLGYLAIPGKEIDGSSKWGHAFGLGALFPTRIGVFGGSVHFLTSPTTWFPVGTFFGGNLTASKELYPGMLVGLGLNLGVITDPDDDFNISGDLGFRYNMGKLLDNNLGFTENFTWAVVFRTLGKSDVPTAFTPEIGASIDLLRLHGAAGKVDPFKAALMADLGFPGFQNTEGKIGLKLVIAELITLSGSTGFNFRELNDDREPYPLTSVGLTVNFALKSGGERIMGGTLPSDGDIAVHTALRPLYGEDMDTFAVGGGIAWTVGVADKTPPVIVVDYPETFYMSPNHDGKADALEFPVSITDQRYIAEWTFEIQNEAGITVRTYRNKELRPENKTVRNVLGRLAAVKSGVDVPDRLRWDGVQDDGSIAPDGTYSFRVTAKDDNGNTAVTKELYQTIVDTVPPEVHIAAMADALKIFSPDGDGNKDTLAIAQTGSLEDLWEGGFFSTEGDKVKTFNIDNGEPADLVWDGQNDDGAIAADGIYAYRISATDRALNTGGDSLENIILDTRASGAFLTTSVYAIAPKEGQAEDLVRFGIILSLRTGIESWSLDIKDESGVVVKSFPADGGPRIPPESIGWNGLDRQGIIKEGRYTPALTVTYTAGAVVTASATPVLVDITGPMLSFNSQPEFFSPDNDGENDDLIINLAARDVSPIASWSLEIREPEAPYPVFYRIEGRGAPAEKILWDGRSLKGELVQSATDYPYTFAAEDTLGNASSTEGKIGVDILVIRDGDKLRIMIPSIVFRPNGADFTSLTADVVENNNRIMVRLARGLNKFRDYKIQVEGHTNPTQPVGPARDNEQPGDQRISEARARFVIDQLARNGIARGRMTAIGVGSLRPLVQFEDRDNWWKNRRVEFILIK